jgi:hypothetical protein
VQTDQGCSHQCPRASYPRWRGANNRCFKGHFRKDELSPLTHGSFGHTEHASFTVRAISADAGQPRQFRPNSCRGPSNPASAGLMKDRSGGSCKGASNTRWRGADHLMKPSTRCTPELSPLAQGKLVQGLGDNVKVRAIPADAGQTLLP